MLSIVLLLVGIGIQPVLPLPLQGGILPSGDGFVSKLISNTIGTLVEGAKATIDELVNFDIVKAFVSIENPYGSEPAFNLWMDTLEISLAIFPIMIILGLLSMPFADEQKTSLWRQGIRAVGVIVLIALSRPLIGFGVDLSNIMTAALMPGSGNIPINAGSAFNTLLNGVGIGIVALYVGWPYLILAILCLLISIVLLELRNFLIYMVWGLSPLLAVFWYADWGMLESVNEFANKFTRMGIYSLLVGPVVAIIIRILMVLSLSASAAGLDGWVGAIWTQAVMLFMFPFLLIASVWKLISWAGEPLGVGQAITAGLAVAGAMGSIPGTGGGGDGDGGSGSGGGGSGSGSGGSGSGSGGSGGSGSSTTSSSGSGGSQGSTTASGTGTLSDVVDKAGASSSEAKAGSSSTKSGGGSAGSPGVDSGAGGGTGASGGGPSERATGTASESEATSYTTDAKNKVSSWKSRGSEAVKGAVGKYKNKAKDKLNPANLQQYRANKAQKKADDLSERQEQFNDAVDFSTGENGEIDLQQAEESGALSSTPAAGEDTARLGGGGPDDDLDAGEFQYTDENGEVQTESVGQINQQYRQDIDENQEKASRLSESADKMEEKLGKQAEGVKQAYNNHAQKRKQRGQAYVQEGLRASVGAHSPYIMQGGRYGGGGGGGGGGGAKAPNPQSEPDENEGPGIARPEHSISASTAQENGEMLSESGERFDLDKEVGYRPGTGSTPDGVSQQGTLVDPESGEDLGEVQVSDDADFNLSQNETNRLGNVRMRKGEDGEASFYADSNSRTFGENEERVDNIIGNSEITDGGSSTQEVTASGVTIREAPGEAESYEGQYYAEGQNGEVLPVNAEDEEADQMLQENVGETGDLTGEVEQQYGMSEDAHDSHQGPHEYNALNVSLGDEGEGETGDGGDSAAETESTDSSASTSESESSETAASDTVSDAPEDESGNEDTPASPDATSGSKGADFESRYGLYDKGGTNEPEPDESDHSTLSPRDLNRGEANPTIDTDRALEGEVSEHPDGHALEDPETGEQVEPDQINDPDNEITNEQGEFAGDVEEGDSARIENVRVGAGGNNIETGAESKITSTAKGGAEVPREDSEASVTDESGGDDEEETGESQSSGSHGFNKTEEDTGGYSSGSSTSQSGSTSSSGTDHGFESASTDSGGDGSSSGDSPVPGGSDTESVPAEEIVQADNAREDLPYKVTPEGEYVYEDTWNRSEIEGDIYNGSDADAEDMIAARGVLHEADENGNIKEDGASYGYIRFGSEHGLSESPTPEINGEKRDPEDGEVLEFNDDSGVKTRQWATENGFNFADARVQQSSGVEHGGEEGAVTTYRDGDEIEAEPENQYIQVVPDEESSLAATGRNDAVAGDSSQDVESHSTSEEDSFDFEFGEDSSVESGAPSGGTTVSHSEGAERDINPETADESEVVEDGEDDEEDEDDEQGEGAPSDSDDDDSGGSGGSSTHDLSEGRGSPSASSEGNENGESKTEGNRSGRGTSEDATEASAEREHDGNSAESDGRVRPTNVGSELNMTDTQTTPGIYSDTEILSESERATLREELEEEHGKEAVDEVYSTLEERVGSPDTMDEAITTEQQLANAALDEDLPTRDVPEGDVDEETVEAFREFIGASNKFVDDNLAERDEQTVYRGMHHRGGELAASIADDPDAEEYEMPDKEHAVAFTPESAAGADLTKLSGSKIVAGKDPEEYDVAAADQLLNEGGGEEATHTTQTEGEMHLMGVEQVQASEMRVSEKLDSTPSEIIRNTTESPEGASDEEHAAMNSLVSEMEKTDAEPETEAGNERLEQWGEHVSSTDISGFDNEHAVENVESVTGRSISEPEEDSERVAEATETAETVSSWENIGKDTGNEKSGRGGVSGGPETGDPASEEPDNDRSISPTTHSTSEENGSNPRDAQETETVEGESDNSSENPASLDDSGGNQGAEDESGSETWEERAQNWRENNIESESESLDKADGFTGESMRVETLDDGEQVFVTDYDDLDDSLGDDDIMNTVEAEDLKQRSLAGQEWTKAMGQDPPNTTYNEDTNEVIQQEAGGAETETWDVENAPDEVLEKVDREEYEETMATQMLSGNIDMNKDNVHVDEEGGLHVIDFDRTARMMGQVDGSEEMEMNAMSAGRIGEDIGEVNDDFHQDRSQYESEVTEKAAEMATDLEESGETDSVLSPVEEVDEEHDTETLKPAAPVIRNNIEAMANEDVDMEDTEQGASEEAVDEALGDLEE